MNRPTDFTRGLIVGVVGTAVIACAIFFSHFASHRDKEVIEYAQRQQVIEELREDFINREPVEFIEAVPGVRGAVDGAAGEFLRKRDEAVQRLRGGYVD